MSSNSTNTPPTPDTDFLDHTLRPNRWEEYIGQNNIKKNLQILLDAAKERSHPPEHLLFYGPPGLGKTTLAHLIAKETSSQMRSTSGPAIEKVGDLASILTNLSPGDILFIDEIHRLNKNIEEILYPAMESRSLDIIIGKGPSARTIQLELPSFTLIGATTRLAMLSSPLRSRFSGGVFRLEFYSPEEIINIIKRSAAILGVEIDKSALRMIAERSRFTPRTANYLLKRARDYAQLARASGPRALVAGDFSLRRRFGRRGLRCGGGAKRQGMASAGDDNGNAGVCRLPGGTCGTLDRLMPFALFTPEPQLPPLAPRRLHLR